MERSQLVGLIRTIVETHGHLGMLSEDISRLPVAVRAGEFEAEEVLARQVQALLRRGVPGIVARVECRSWYTSSGYSRSSDRRVFYVDPTPT